MLAIAGAGALAALVADGEPTNLAVVDALYRSAFAATVAWFAAYARRWVWIVVSTVAAVAGTAVVAALGAALVGLGLAWWSVVADQSRRWVGAVVGALVANALLRLPSGPFFGAASLVAGLAAALVIGNALPGFRRRRRVVAGVALVGAAAAVVSAAAALATLSVVSDAESAMARAETGLDALSDGDDGRAVAAFNDAHDRFAGVSDRVGAPWLAPARLVPVVGRHLDVAQTVAAEGEALSLEALDAGAILATRQYLDAEGNLDVDRLAALAPQATSVSQTMTAALARIDDADNGWLLSPAADRLDEARGEILDVLPTVSLSALALESSPQLLGGDAPRAYLVLVGNPAEARELGGLASAFGILRVTDGEFTYDQSESRLDVARLLREAGVEAPAATPAGLAEQSPVRFPQNWTSSPDLAAVTDLSVSLWEAVHPDQRLDGVLYVDPFALAALLEFTGPVDLAEQGVVLTGENAVEFLLRDQYVAFDDLGAERDDALEDVADVVFDRLTDELPDPRALVEALAPQVAARHLLFRTHDAPTTEPLLERAGLAGTFASPPTADLIVTTANTRANKLDAYLGREVDATVVVGDDDISATVTVKLTNTVPDGLGTYVTGTGDVPDDVPELTNRTVLSVHGPWELAQVSVDDEPSGSATRRSSSTTFQHAVTVEVDQGETVVVTFELFETGDLDLRTLRVVPTPSARPGALALRVDGPEPTRLDQQGHHDTVEVPLR